MRGDDHDQSEMYSYVMPEQRVPAGHPLRPVLKMANQALGQMNSEFAKLYSSMGRPSIPPEKLLRALLLQLLYSIRSERMLMEQLEYNLLFRWFVGMSMDEQVWDATVYSKNRDRLLDGEIAESFFAAVLEQARQQGLLSDEHFTVDGTLLEAWASKKSFGPRQDPPQRGSGRNGKKLLRDTHVCSTDPDARLYKKSTGEEARLCHMGHLVTENRNGLVVAATVTAADTGAERRAALAMLDDGVPRHYRATIGADKAYDEREFVKALRERNITPHIAQYTKRPSNLDGRTTRHDGYCQSLKKRKRIEEVFGWLKTVGLMRKVRHRGTALVKWCFTFASAAYNLVRMRTLIPNAA